MSEKRKNWTREDHVLAFNLYCKTVFGQMHSGNPEIIKLAKVLGRSPGSVAMKLTNFARLDPELHARGIRGMQHGAKGEGEIWLEFEDNPEALAFESEQLLAQRTGRKLEDVAEIEEADLPKEGLERERMVRVRVNQKFFRDTILSAYDYQCCITGLAVPELLVASHIIGWAKDRKQRMNPRNGLCLNALHDRAFDRGMMFVANDMTVHFRESLIRHEKRNAGLDWLLSYEGKPISLPRKFKPDATLLAKHATS